MPTRGSPSQSVVESQCKARLQVVQTAENLGVSLQMNFCKVVLQICNTAKFTSVCHRTWMAPCSLAATRLASMLLMAGYAMSASVHSRMAPTACIKPKDENIACIVGRRRKLSSPEASFAVQTGQGTQQHPACFGCTCHMCLEKTTTSISSSAASTLPISTGASPNHCNQERALVKNFAIGQPRSQGDVLTVNGAALRLRQCIATGGVHESNECQCETHGGQSYLERVAQHDGLHQQLADAVQHKHRRLHTREQHVVSASA